METTYFKFNAKKRMVNNHFKCFIVSVFPFMTVVLLIMLNYFLAILLNSINTGLFSSHYAIYTRSLLLMISAVASVCVWKSVQFLVDSYFLLKTLNKNITLKQTKKCVSFRQCMTLFIVSAIRFFLSVSWFMAYLSPCMVVSALLIYSYMSENNGNNINLTLLVSAITLFITGISFLYITLKRYSMCSSIILTEEEKNPLKVIAKSIEYMENHSVEYAVYCLSFLGWILLCLLVIPAIYVLPYLKMSKSCYQKSLGLSKFVKKNEEKEKPIVFYFPKRAHN